MQTTVHPSSIKLSNGPSSEVAPSSTYLVVVTYPSEACQRACGNSEGRSKRESRGKKKESGEEGEKRKKGKRRKRKTEKDCIS